MLETPSEAKKILASASPTSAQQLETAIRRTSYDPVVLRQDGWTTTKSEEPIGATGGPFMIGEMIRWQNEDAVVIAYVHDNEIGDLWKGVWIDTQNFITFDMEAEELRGAKQKWERRKNPKMQSTEANFRKSSRYAVSEDFSVKGVEHGIVLASSTEKGARPGVFWPARVMHASEASGSSTQAKRSSAKQKVEVVFLAPYWSSSEFGSRGRRVEGLSESGDSSFQAGDLFHLELIEAAGEVIKEYPYDPSKGLDLDHLRMSFRFTGLPKGTFQRFLDSHRLALALKAYAMEKASKFTASDLASAGLFETHPMAVQAPVFPVVVLHLPFSYILSELPSLPRDGSENETKTEPIIQISGILNSMKPPQCWSTKCQTFVPTASAALNRTGPRASAPDAWLVPLRKAKDSSTPLEIKHFAGNLPHLEDFLIRAAAAPAIEALALNVTRVISSVSGVEEDNDARRRDKLVALTKSWAMLKTQGDEAIASIRITDMDDVRADWRRACERIYRFITSGLSGEGFGNGFCNIITDPRCNLHRTLGANFERSVRLPAAIAGARRAGAGTEINIPLISVVPDHYMNFVEKDLLKKAHSSSYLKRMKDRCAVATADDFMLTEDSDGNGGQDTHGSRGTWTAAVCGVAAAVCAVDRIVTGECVNAFCATRPPGHHAGRSLHPMKAVSNGFCVLNAAACAAIHATTPVSQGGCGLGKVCILDFDVHHVSLRSNPTTSTIGCTQYPEVDYCCCCCLLRLVICPPGLTPSFLLSYPKGQWNTGYTLFHL
jgi:Histone deacetylase domain